ncbi:MAG TPA: glycosyltransferase family 2 protein [Thermoplasmata archaeon]|nr:glycosyltransferase family 2 protein [Thermoplasmata archaeon]
MSDGPEIAVVVTAYQRRTYLLSAVRSVLAQTLPRDRFEVVVAKDFDDPEIDRFLHEAGVQVRQDTEPRIGGFLWNAVQETRAPYVAFLDDDDEFAPDHLARALEVLRAHPEIGFYRNRVVVIDQEGKEVPHSEWRRLERDDLLDRRGAITVPPSHKDGVVRLGLDLTRASFNSSTMVVRRALLEGNGVPVLRRTMMPDLAFFVFAVLGPYGLYLDDRRLTRYRNYPGNKTRETSWLDRASIGFDEIAQYARSHGGTELADRIASEASHYARLFRGESLVERIGEGAPRREVARLAGEYLKFLGRHPAEIGLSLDVWAAGMYAASYLAMPGLARQVNRRQIARRRS